MYVSVQHDLLVIPTELQSCAATPPGITPPHTPRTVDATLTWAERTEIAREMTAKRLDECRYKLGQLNALIEKALSGK